MWYRSKPLNAIAAEKMNFREFFATPGRPRLRYRAKMELTLGSLVNEALALGRRFRFRRSTADVARVAGFVRAGVAVTAWMSGIDASASSRCGRVEGCPAEGRSD